MKLLIVDDHELIRDGLSYVLKRIDDNVEVLQAGEHVSALELMRQHQDIDLALIDLDLPVKNGFELLEEASRLYPTIPMAVLSGSCKREDVNRALNSSALGYIPKATSSEVMINAVRIILAGGLYQPPDSVFDSPDASTTLTPRQADVLALMKQGLSNKVIAAELGISEATTKMHLTAIFKRLGVTNRTQAVIAAQSFEAK